MLRRATLLLSVACAAACTGAPAPEPPRTPAPVATTTPSAPMTTGRHDIVTVPPREVVAAWHLSPFYAKYLDVGGLPVIASSRVSDYAVLEAAFLIRRMIGERADILRALADAHIRFVVMAPAEMTTDIPEHSDLTPKAYWDRRARGLGATDVRPAVSCGEENLLDLAGDPYWAENILVHEFAHAIHEEGLRRIDPTFDQRLTLAYEHARATGLWSGTYASQNRMEYWAEATQSWFDCNRVNDAEHGPIDTRAKLVPYDPDVAALLKEVYGDGPWRYAKPSRRPASDRTHLAGFDVATAGRFAWPTSAPPLATVGDVLPWLDPSRIPAASGGGGGSTSVVFANHRAQPVSLEWVDFGGQRRAYATIRPGMTQAQSTYAGHVWIASENGRILGGVIAADGPHRAEIP